MSIARGELREALHRYTTDTLTYMNTVTDFCVKISTWTSRMTEDLISMKNIKDKVTAGNKKEELQKDLAGVLEATLGGLEKLDCFLEAVEKLAVTSLHVFMEEKLQVLSLPKGIVPEHIQEIIVAARLFCPLLLGFKRDTAAFFLPKLQNLEVLSFQLDKYIQTTELICERFHKSCNQNLLWNMKKEMVVDLGEDLSDDEIQKMLCHINQLDEIRKDSSFRMVFLFRKVSCFKFIREFNSRKPKMLQFLKDLEECAVQLENMNKGAKISSVAGSSVGVLGGALSIAGLALMPFTAGLSLGLTMTGLGLGVTSGVNSVVTTATEIAVNSSQQNKANDVFRSFMEDIQGLQDCLEEVTNQPLAESEANNEAGENASAEARAEAANKPIGKELMACAGAAVKVPLAVSKAARAGLIGVNALFIGMDVFFICKDGVGLAQGSETEVSQFIRARAALWSSEMDSWQKINDSLCEGGQKSEKNEAMLKTPFYPEGEMKKKTKDKQEKKKQEKQIPLKQVEKA